VSPHGSQRLDFLSLVAAKSPVMERGPRGEAPSLSCSACTAEYNLEGGPEQKGRMAGGSSTLMDHSNMISYHSQMMDFQQIRDELRTEINRMHVLLNSSLGGTTFSDAAFLEVAKENSANGLGASPPPSKLNDMKVEERMRLDDADVKHASEAWGVELMQQEIAKIRVEMTDGKAASPTNGNGSYGKAMNGNGNGYGKEPTSRQSALFVANPTAIEAKTQLGQEMEEFKKKHQIISKKTGKRAAVKEMQSWSLRDEPLSSKCFVSHPWFEVITATAIALNSVMIGIEVDTTSRGFSVPGWLNALGITCSVYFLLEVIARIYAFRTFFFTDKKNRAWNLFDLTLVILSGVDFAMSAQADSDSEGGAGSIVFAAIKTLKMFRILRLFRVFRFSRQLSNLAVMIAESVNALLWAIVMLILIIYIFSICITTSCSEWVKIMVDYRADPNWFGNVVNNDREEVRVVHKKFGSLSDSANTLLQIMLGGLDWGEIMDALFFVDALTPTLVFFYIAFTMLAVLNVVTGVFVDNALESTKSQRDYQIDKAKELTDDMIIQVRHFFNAIDTDRSGEISKEEMLFMLQDDDLAAFWNVIGFEDGDADLMFQMCERHAGFINFSEFLECTRRLRGQARSIDLHAILQETRGNSYKLRELESMLRGKRR